MVLHGNTTWVESKAFLPAESEKIVGSLADCDIAFSYSIVVSRIFPKIKGE